MVEDVGLEWSERDENKADIYLNLVELGFNF